MRVGTFSSCLLSIYLLLSCSALPQAKEYHKVVNGGAGSEYVPASDTRENGLGREPSCEQLRAMWRFSKRQSRATEITNEIPTYRDPFAYNMWIPYARPRSIVGVVGNRRKPPVFGRPVFEEPRTRTRDEMARLFSTVPQGAVLPTRKVQTAFRLSGGGVPMGQLPHLTPQIGSFQHLQKLIRAERARELQQQRMAEEEAARHAALKDVNSPAYFGRMVQDPPGNQQSASSSYNLYEKTPTQSQGIGKGRVLAFPDMMAQTAQRYNDDEYLATQFTGPIYSHRSMPDSISRTAGVDRGFFRH